MVEELYVVNSLQVDDRIKGVPEADEDIAAAPLVAGTVSATGSESKRSRHDSSMSLDSSDDRNRNRSRSSSRSSVASNSDKSRQTKDVKESLPEIEYKDKVSGACMQAAENVSSDLLPTASPARSDSDRSEKSMSISPARSVSANTDSEAKGDVLPELKSDHSAAAPDVHSRSSSESKKLSPVASLKQQSSPERNSESRSPSSTPTGRRSTSATRDRSVSSSSSSASSRKASPERRKSRSSSSSSSSAGSHVSRKSSEASENVQLPNDEKESVEQSNEVDEAGGFDLPADDDISLEPESSDLHSIPLPIAPLPTSAAPLPTPARAETPVQAVSSRRSPSPQRKNSKSTSRSPPRRSASKSSVRRNTSRLRSRSRSRSARRFRLVFVMETLCLLKTMYSV